MFGPPLEMFHCGGTAIVYDVSGHDEYIIDGKNALVVHKHDDEKIIEYINKLKNDNSLLLDLKKEALLTAETWPDWSEASAKFENALIATMQENQYVSDKVKKQTKVAFKFYSTALWKTNKPSWVKNHLMGTWLGDHILQLAKKTKEAILSK
jgi:hypothetical protein